MHTPHHDPETHGMSPAQQPRSARRRRRRAAARASRPLLALACLAALAAGQDAVAGGTAAATTPTPTLEETRLSLGKWIETQQIISRERNDWQQGREILQDRVALVKKEVATLQEAIAQAQSGVHDSDAKREELRAENEQLKAAGAQLTTAVQGMEGQIRKLYPSLPDPIQTRLQPLFQRIPAEGVEAHVSAAERFQNVLGILNELNKANNDIAVSYEVRTMADGRTAEVKVIYVGLAQAYYVSARGEAGIGRPSADGWVWEPAPAVAADVLSALEILQGKQSPAFVPLPVKLQ